MKRCLRNSRGGEAFWPQAKRYLASAGRSCQQHGSAGHLLAFDQFHYHTAGLKKGRHVRSYQPVRNVPSNAWNAERQHGCYCRDRETEARAEVGAAPELTMLPGGSGEGGGEVRPTGEEQGGVHRTGWGRGRVHPAGEGRGSRTSRAFSCPTSPALAGLAAPLSSRPSPLTWLCAAMRCVFDVLFTSSIFMATAETAEAAAVPTRPARYLGGRRHGPGPGPAPRAAIGSLCASSAANWGLLVSVTARGCFSLEPAHPLPLVRRSKGSARVAGEEGSAGC